MDGIIIQETFEMTTDDPDYKALMNEAFEKASLTEDALDSLVICLMVNRGLMERVRALEDERRKWADLVLKDQAHGRVIGEGENGVCSFLP